MIGHLSKRAFQIELDDDHEACQLIKIIFPDFGPCEFENRRHNQFELVVSPETNITKVLNPAMSRPLSKYPASMGAGYPSDVLLQAGAQTDQQSPEHNHFKPQPYLFETPVLPIKHSASFEQPRDEILLVKGDKNVVATVEAAKTVQAAKTVKPTRTFNPSKTAEIAAKAVKVDETEAAKTAKVDKNVEAAVEGAKTVEAAKTVTAEKTVNPAKAVEVDKTKPGRNKDANEPLKALVQMALAHKALQPPDCVGALLASTTSNALFADQATCVALILIPTAICMSTGPVTALVCITLCLALRYAHACGLSCQMEESKTKPWNWAERATPGAPWWSETQLWTASIVAGAAVIGGCSWTGAATLGVWLLAVKGAASTVRGAPRRTRMAALMVVLLVALLAGGRMVVPAERGVGDQVDGVDGVRALPSPFEFPVASSGLPQCLLLSQFAYHQTRRQDLMFRPKRTGQRRSPGQYLSFPFATLSMMPSATVLPSATDASSPTRMWVANTTAVVVRRRLTEVSNWEAMKTACGSSGTVTLSDGFVMGTYTSQIVFNGKHLVIIGNGKTLDAGANG
jgi:hypothetical protein